MNTLMKYFSLLLVTSLLLLGSLSLLAVPSIYAASPQANSSSGAGCIAHRPEYIPGTFWVNYSAGCSGHDEPELDPVSNAPNSALILPTDGSFLVSSLGPTFWFGGTVTDPHSLFGQAFVELQFYADGIVTSCTPQGGFVLTFSRNSYTVCSPVWEVTPSGNSGGAKEVAAFNAMLTDGGSNNPLIMHGGDTITVHWYTTSASDGFHVTVSDLTTGGSGTIILNSKHDGPLMPYFSTQQIGNALGWGIVNDTPNSFVWEIGHTSDFANPAGRFCVPGQTNCFSYDSPAWSGVLPIDIMSVTFGGGAVAHEWAVVSDFGGIAEVNTYCGASNYGSPFCVYPWYTLGRSGFHYGVDYPGNINDFGQATQFQLAPLCGGPFGPSSTYCDTVIVR